MSARVSFSTRSLILVLMTVVGFTSMVATAHADREFDLRFSADATGSIAMIANTNMTCSTANGATGASTCADARNAGVTSSVNSANDYRNNNAHTSAYIDVDSDSSTFNSSTADQSLPAGSTVLFAGLYWGGHYAGASSPANANLRNQVQFKVPGASSYTTVTSSTLDDGVGANAGRYQAFADVTALLKTLPNGGNGTYAVGNIQSAIGSDRYAGWSLIVAYKNPNESMKNMTVFDGLVSISGTITRNISVSGFLTPPAGPINAQVGIVAWEGDLGLNGDRAQLNGQYMSDAQHPSTNFFDSRISHKGTLFTDRNPAYPNSLGMDAAWTEPPAGSIGNSDTSATITVNSTGDQYLPGVIAFQVEIFSPDIKMEKEALDADGNPITTLAPGDTITYRIAGTNTGQDGTTNLVLTDPIPANTTYVPNSLKIVTNDGGSTGNQTDVSSDDLAEFDSGNNLVRYRLGQGANATTGGNLAPDKSYEVTFQVTVDGSTADGTDIHNEARSTMRSQTADIELEADADSDVEVVNKQADLRITKTASVDEITPGGNFTYTFVVKNNGPSDATGVEVTDSLPAGVTFVSSDDCDNAGQDLTCEVGALASGDAVTLTVTVKAADNVTGDVVNTATVDGDQPDPTSGNNSSTDTTPVSPQADLGIVKTASVDEIVPDETFLYTFNVTNNGPSNATGITVTDTLPAGVTYVDGPPGCSASGQVVTCTINFLASGGSAQTGISVKYNGDDDTVENTAAVSSDLPDPNPDNDKSTDKTPVQQKADVEIVKSVDNATPSAGDTVTYTLTVTNNGPGAAKNVIATDSLPDGVTFVSVDAPCVESNGDISCELGTLAAGETVELEVQVTVDPWTPAGPGDAHGIDVQKVETQIDLNPGETKTIQVECPAGYIVSDGSVRVDHIDQGTGSWLSPEVTESRAVNDRTWQGTVTNTASGRAQAKIFAVCIGVETAETDGHTHTITVNAPVTETVTLEANGQATAVLECPDGTIATQPGFVADAAGHMSYSQPEGNGWKFVYDVGSSADTDDEITFSIACLERTLSAADDGHTTELQLQRIWTEQVIQPGQVHEVQLTCPDGSKGIVAGWDLDDGLYSLGNDPRPVTRAFKVYNPTNEPLTARFSLLCLGDRTVPAIGDGPAITNVGEVETTTTETDTDNNRSAVTIHPAGDGTAVPDGNGKPPVNSSTDRDDHRPGNKPAGMATKFRSVGKAWARNGEANFRVRSNGWARGNAKLVTTRRVKVGNRTLRKGAVLARGAVRINRAGVTRLRVNLTRQGRQAVRHRRVIRPVRVMVTGKNAGVTRLHRR